MGVEDGSGVIVGPRVVQIGVLRKHDEYAERHRYGERVSTAFVESTVNAVVGKRFSKRQQMRWSKPGAHLMLQTRTRVLDDTLRTKFQSWYPGLFNVRNPGPHGA